MHGQITLKIPDVLGVEEYRSFILLLHIVHLSRHFQPRPTS